MQENTQNVSSFVHLHTHTEYSLGDSSNKVAECVRRAKELGMTACAITDHGVMFGVIDFYKAAKAEGIKPIIGCEVYVAPKSRTEKDTSSRYHHLVLLAENQKGYENIGILVSKGYMEGFYYKPRVDKELLRQYSEGIICLSACLAGEIPRLLTNGDYDKAKMAALEYEQIFGKGNFFLELQDHGIEAQKNVNRCLIQMSRETGIPLVCTNDVHYTKKEDAASHEVLICIGNGKKLSEYSNTAYATGEFYLKSPQEMHQLFSYVPEALQNTQYIADRCNLELEFGHTKLPKYEVPEGYDSWTYLKKLCYDGLYERYGEKAKELEERLTYELETIHSMGFVDYFLIVWDFINFAKKNGIPVGPGRGSAAGAIVSYCLHITDIDPIHYDLLFERFLNPERVTMPDIDVDICYERRQEVIDYVKRKYGEEKVVQIIAFGTLAAKAVVRDVVRVMDMPYAFGDALAKAIPTEVGMTIEKALMQNAELKERYEKEANVKNVLDMCMKLEGLPRNTSTHAAGVVICPKAAEELIPLAKSPDGVVITQYSKELVEEVGLLKMDFLALRTLTVLKNACDDVKRLRGKEIDLSKIDYNDPNVLSYIGTGKTEGVFQLESAGMRNFMKQLRPKSIEDLIAGISLYRPGPLDFIPQYIAGKENPQKISYLTPELEPILEPTYGTIVYQEQVMRIVRDLAGYSLGRSDLVRRAMSKKKASVMEKEKQNFIYGNEAEGVPGCINRGISEEAASQIYDSMMDFAKYAFNKSHAACYAIVAYQTAYMKYYYKTEYMAALLSSVADNADKVINYIGACRKENIVLLPPSINKSFAEFTVEGDAIRFGLLALKGVGDAVLHEVTSERQKQGAFTSLTDFCKKVGTTSLNKKALEAMIYAGSFDELGGNRKQYLTVYENIASQYLGKKKRTDMDDGQISFEFESDEEDDFEDFEDETAGDSLPAVADFSADKLLEMEKEVSGVYLSGHPLDEWVSLMAKYTTISSEMFREDEDTGLIPVKNDMPGRVGGMISHVKEKQTKKGDAMAFVDMEDLTGKLSVTVFPVTYAKYKHLIKTGVKVFVTGKVQVNDKGTSFVADSIIDFQSVVEKNGMPKMPEPEVQKPLSETKVAEKKMLWVRYPNMSAYMSEQEWLRSVLQTGTKGPVQIILYLSEEKQQKTLTETYDLSVCDIFKQKYGDNNVRLL